MIKKAILCFIFLFLLGCNTECDVDKLPLFVEGDESNEVYGFCIPNSEEEINEVKEIVPDALFYEEHEGLVGCNVDTEFLVELGYDTPEEKVCELSNLKYIKNISIINLD